MDNHHVYINQSSMSCGAIELSRISDDHNQVLYSLATHLYHPSKGTPSQFVLWSTLSCDLMKYINETLDKECVIVCGEGENPKTGNYVYLFIMDIPHESFKTWYINERVKRIRKL